MFFSLLIACSGGGPVSLREPDVLPATLDVTVSPAWDPLLESSLAVRFTADAAGTLDLTVSDAAGTPVLTDSLIVGDDGLADWSWDGLDDEAPGQGTWFLSGVYTRSDGESAELTTEVEVVRLGFDQAWAEDDAGATGTRIPLTWHMNGETQQASTAFSQLDALDADGVALDFPELTPVLGRPMDGYSQPLAYVWDSLPLMTVSLGAAAVVGERALSLDVDGWTVVTDGPLVAGEAVTLQRDAPLSDGVGVVDETLRLGFAVTDEHGETHDLGAQFLPVRFYALFDAPSVEVWPAAIQPALLAIDGAAPVPEDILDGLVDWVFSDLGLSYDTDWGASYYTAYFSEDWEQGHFYFSDFLDRRFGSTVNCSDCASIMVAYANMLGVPLNYRIIGWNFQLNQILAIGGSEFTNCPFGPGGCGFTYHAVTGGLDYEAIWDATLSLDGDSDPTNLPSEPLMVQSIDDEEYLERLVKSGRADYAYEARGTHQ
jgi:hypothetical protein